MVGKTCIVKSLKGIPFDENQISTIGVDDILDEAKFDNKFYKFKIFDTAGQERYKSISTNTVQFSDGFLLVFSVCNKESFERINYWISTIEDKVNIKEEGNVLMNPYLFILITSRFHITKSEKNYHQENEKDCIKKYKK